MWVWAGLVEKLRSNMLQKSYYTLDGYVILLFNNVSMLYEFVTSAVFSHEFTMIHHLAVEKSSESKDKNVPIFNMTCCL